MEDRNQSSPSLPKKPIKYKLLRRALRLTGFRCEDSNPKLVCYAKMRRIHFKEIKDQYNEEKGRRHYYSNSKQLSCLKSFDIILKHESHDKKLVKLMKNLKSIKIFFSDAHSIRPCINLIKIIPKNIEAITVSSDYKGATIAEIKSLYRNLRCFRKLRTLEKNRCELYQDKNPEEYAKLIEVDYHSINQYIPRLRNLKRICCREPSGSGQDFEKYMSQDQICPYVTDLEMTLTQEVLGCNYSKNNSHNTIPPMFRFHLFPRLQTLKIKTGYARMSLDPIISQGFKSLLELKQLTLDILREIRGRKFLFEGLIHLPLLDLFDLSMTEDFDHDFENDEEPLLAEFLQRQTQLVSLTLRIQEGIYSRRKHKAENEHLERICRSFNNNPKLKYLHLDVVTWSLQSLSKGLSHAKMVNQFRELKIGVFNDILISSLPPHNKLEGLCDFIERQKESLYKIQIEAGVIFEDEIADRLARVIGETNNLIELSFSINSSDKSYRLIHETVLKQIPQESFKRSPSFKKTFSTLNQVLPLLKQLSSLNLKLNPIACPYDAPVFNTSVILNGLPSLTSLERLSLCLPFLEQSIRADPAQALLLDKITTLKDCSVSSSDVKPDIWRNFKEEAKEGIEIVEKILKNSEQRRYIRRNLTFSSSFWKEV